MPSQCLCTYLLTRCPGSYSGSINASSPTASDGRAWVNISGGTPPYTLLWVTGASFDTLTHLQADTYSITVTDSNNCSATASAIVSAPTAISNISAALVKLYPNPANTQVVIETGANNGKFIFGLYSMDGKLVKEENIADSKTSVDLQQLSAGLYTYRLRDLNTGGLQYGKLEIQR